MIDKVKKYLLRHNEINFYKKNESGSEYYRVGNSIIRVSDHVATSRNDPDTLNIVVSGDNFVVMFGNKIINVNDYDEFKKFLKYHIQMCDCFKDLINKGLGRTSKSPETLIVQKTFKTDNPFKELTKSELRALPIDKVMPYIHPELHNFDLSGLTAKQILGLSSMVSHGKLASKEAIQKNIDCMLSQK